MNLKLWILLLPGVLATASPLLAGSARGDAATTPLRVEYDGCETLLEGPVCVVSRDAPTLTLWLGADAGSDVLLEADRRRLKPLSQRSSGGGTLYELRLPPGVGLLRLSAGAGASERGWSLRIDRRPGDPQLDQAREMLRSGDHAGARQLLEEALAQGAVDRGAGLGLLGRALRNQRQTEAARETLREAIATRRDDGDIHGALTDATVLAFSLMHKGRHFTEAREVLAAFDDYPAGHARGRYYLDYFRGLIGFNSGDARSALRLLQAASARAGRFDWQRLQLVSEMMLAVQLQQLGRSAQAAALLEPWRDRLPADLLPCERAEYLTSLTWSRLLTLEAGDRGEDPTPVAEEALAAFGEACGVDGRVNARINLALAHLHGGRSTAAARHLEQARELTDTPELRMLLWALDVEGRIALSRGNADGALGAFERLEGLAGATLSPTARWRAAVGRGTALHALGQHAEALAAFAAADGLLDDDVFRVPLDQGRETLLATREWAARRHLALLLELDRSEDALVLVRQARSRVLRSLRPAERIETLAGEERRAWDTAMGRYQALREELAAAAELSWALPADQLARLEARREQSERRLRRILDDAVTAAAGRRESFSPPAPPPGELLVAFHRLPEGWATLTRAAGLTEAHRVSCDGDGEGLAACLLEPARAAIGRADRVRVLATGPLRDVDFHAVPWADDVLMATTPVVYGADLPRPPTALPRGGNALLVADPSGDLGAARAEAGEVARILASAGAWSARLLEGEEANGAQVHRLLEQADLFHYAGHARFAGELGWDSELRLANEQTLSVADILALSSPPTVVVLSGCETAATAAGTVPESIGLANAFLASGAQLVLAALRPVDDVVARELVTAFYREWVRSTPPHVALQTAQLALREHHADEDWSAFRLIER